MGTFRLFFFVCVYNITTMTRKLNINLFTASVAEHTHQLRYHMRYPISRFFQNLNEESKDVEDFISKLKLVEDWNQRTIDDVLNVVIKCVKNTHFQVKLAIKAIITARTMLLVAIGNANNDVMDTVRIDIPDPLYFMHTIMTFVAAELIIYPTLLTNSVSLIDGRQRKHFFHAIINDAIEYTIVDQLASAAVTSYLDSALDIDRLDRDDSDDEYGPQQTSNSSGHVDNTFIDSESSSPSRISSVHNDTHQLETTSADMIVADTFADSVESEPIMSHSVTE